MKLKKFLATLAVALMPTLSFAAGGGFPLDDANIDMSDKASLQRGAQAFVNNCMGCHSASYHRYSHVARDLGLDEQDVVDNLVYTTDKEGERTKVGSLMFNNMSKDYGGQAFGTMPPNLALIARSRGVDWLYTYLRTFYQDDSRPVGVNNLVFPDVGMPHVLWELQGIRKANFVTATDSAGHEQVHFDGFEQVTPGTLSEKEYNQYVRDLVNFLAYLADPVKSERHSLGIIVMIFLFIFLGVAMMLKKEYWKDIKK
jgi:ubiquinol-cytochrome c reductase cytochrome c1 subunit